MRRVLAGMMLVLVTSVCLAFAANTGRGIVHRAFATERPVQNDEKPKKTWQSYEIEELIKKRAESKRAYLSFLNEPTMNMGVFFLPKDGVDRQSPHDLDEVYYVLSGKAILEVDGDDIPCKPGSVLFVKAHAKHRFHSIDEDLTLLVFFSAAKPEEKR
jgi:mannose-6-phosphate isomerase-like protein (cupin superfamily)